MLLIGLVGLWAGGVFPNLKTSDKSRAVGLNDPKVEPSEVKPQPLANTIVVTAAPASAKVQAMIKQIDADDQTTAQKGVKALGGVDAEEARGAVPALTRALVRHKEDDFRREVAEELERIGPPSKEDVTCLGPVYRSGHKRAQLYAIESLGQLGSQAVEGAPILAQALKDHDSEVRKKAADALRRMGPSARYVAFRILLAASDADEVAGAAALEALYEQGKLTAGEIDLLNEAAGDEKRRQFIRYFAVMRLGEEGDKAVKAVPTLIRVLDNEKDAKLLTHSIEALRRIGNKEKQTLAALLRLAQSQAPERVRLASLDALNRLDPSAFSIIQMLERTAPGKEANGKVLLRIKQLLDARLESLKTDEMIELQPVLRHKDAGFIEVGLDLVIRKKNAAGLVPDLVELAKHKEDKVSDKALHALEFVGPDAKSSAPTLIRVLENEKGENEKDAKLLLHSVEALGRIGSKEKQTLAALLRVVQSQAPERVRLASLDALNRLDPSAFSIIQMLERTAPGKEANEKVLLRIKQLLDARLESLKTDEMIELQPVLRYKDAGVIEVGLNLVIRKKNVAGLVPDLVELVKHKEDKVSDKALRALEFVGPDAKASVPTLIAALKEIDKERRCRLAVLLAAVEPKGDMVRQAVLVPLIEGLHPSRIVVRGEQMQQPIHKALRAIGQPAVDAIFTTFKTFKYRGKEEGAYRKNLFQALESLAPELKSKANHDTLKQLHRKELREYQATKEAAVKALTAMDPG